MSYPRPPGLRWGLALFIFSIAVLWLIFGTVKVHGQTNSNEALQTSEALLQTLIVRLEERQKQAEQLQKDLQETSNSLAELSQRYDLLEKNWINYRIEVADLQRDYNRAKVFAWAFGVTTVAGAVACIIMALR